MKYRVSKEILWKKVDNEVVIVNPEKDEYCSLNCTAAEIWEMIASGCPADEIIEKICDSYDEESSIIRKDAEKIIKELLRSGYIENA